MENNKTFLNRKILTNGWNALVYVFFPVLLSRYLLNDDFFPRALFNNPFIAFTIISAIFHTYCMTMYDENSLIDAIKISKLTIDFNKLNKKNLLNLHKFSLMTFTTSNIFMLLWIGSLMLAVVSYKVINVWYVDLFSMIYYYYVTIGFVSGLLFIFKTK